MSVQDAGTGPPVYGRSVKPISIRGADSAHPLLLGPQIFSPSDIAAVSTINTLYALCNELKTFFALKTDSIQTLNFGSKLKARLSRNELMKS